MFTVDRVQYSEILNKLVIFEFIEVNSLDDIVISESGIDFTRVKEYVDCEKMEFLIEASEKNYVFLIISNRSDEKLCVINYKSGQVLNSVISDFKNVSNWFKRWNDIDGSNRGYSKALGTVKEDDFDQFVNKILGELHNKENYKDDCGLKLTKLLLGNNHTKGFDLDLYCYDKNINKNVIIEFLKRETPYVTNITANPMGYCWTNKKNDNKRKFIALWNAKEVLNAEFYLVNYSDDLNEELGISHITQLDKEKGILGKNILLIMMD